jgi:hypothetical protein
MKKFPRAYPVAEGVYNANESGEDGYFPAGMNGSWHSGIHMPNMRETPLFPLAGGKLVAFRVNDAYKKITRYKVIAPREYAKLPSNIQALYQKDAGRKDGPGLFRLKEGIGGEETYSSGFALVRHSIGLRAKDRKNVAVTFFSLYTPLLPDNEYEHKNFLDFTTVTKNAEYPKLPFYRTWLFRVSARGGLKAYNSEGKVLRGLPEGSEFELRNPEAFLAQPEGTHALAGGAEYLHIREARDVEVKTAGRKDYAQFNTTVYPDENVSVNTFLGYPAWNSKQKFPCDFVLFLKDVSFMEKDLQPVEGYIVPKTKPLYGIKRVETCEEFFPAQTTFSILQTESAASSKVFHVKIKTMIIHFLKDHSTEIFYPVVTEAPQELRSDGPPRGPQKEQPEMRKERFRTITVEPSIIWLLPSRRIEFAGSGIKCQYAHADGAYSEISETLPFAGKFERIYKTLKGRTLRQCGPTKEEENLRPLLLNFSPLPEEFDFWFTEDALRGTADIGPAEIVLKQAATLTFSRTNPLDNEFYDANRPRSFDLTHRGIPREEYSREGRRAYCEFRLGEERWYLPKDEAQLLKVDFADWKAFFTRIEDKEKDVFCHIQNDILRHLPLKGSAKERAAKIMHMEDLRPLLQNPRRDADEDAIAQALRTLVCRHPLEWDREIFNDIESRAEFSGVYTGADDRLRYLREKLEGTDIWQGIRSVEGIEGEKNLWCAHPVYFIEHLDRLGALEFNPYWGEHELPSGKKFTCVTNPGFAPLALDNKNQIKDFLFNGEQYAGLTGLFNEDYRNANQERMLEDYEYYWHEGVDFSGTQARERIKSFIRGTVMQAGTSAGGMGEYIVVQDMQEPRLYYVLVHLASYTVQAGDVVYPGDTVGTVGQDREKTAKPHLHLSHVFADTLAEVVNSEHRFPFWEFQVGPNHKSRKIVKDPFDHSKSWNGRWKNTFPKNKEKNK